MKGSIALRKPTNAPISNTNSTTNITTAAYVQLTAALGNGASAVNLMNTSAQPLILAVGGAGSEVDKLIIGPGLTETLPIELKKGDRLSAKAVGATANTGFLVVNTLG